MSSRYIVSQKIRARTVGIDNVTNPSNEVGEYIQVEEFSTMTLYFFGSTAGNVVFRLRVQDPFISTAWDYFQTVSAAAAGAITYAAYQGTAPISGTDRSVSVPLEIGDAKAIAIEIISYTGDLSVGVTLSAGV